jgi:DNA-binding GntR family transcriptional regulator
MYTDMELQLLSQVSNLSVSPAYRHLSDWVVLKVLDGVRKGLFTPGQRLTGEELARTFQVSRAPVRDAMHKLEQLGVIERRRPRGTYVREWTDKDRAEILFILDALIVLSVELSVGRLTADDFAQLDQIIAETRAPGEEPDEQTQIERDSEFHRIIARASGNGRLVELMEQLMLPLQIYATESHNYFQRDFWIRIHSGLIEALRTGDLDAAVHCSLRNTRESRKVLLGKKVTDGRTQPGRSEQQAEG